MLVGIAGFILAALAVFISGPGLGLDHEFGWLPALAYVIGFAALQSYLGKKGRALVEHASLKNPPRARPLVLVLIQVLFFGFALYGGWSEFVQTRLGLADLWLVPAVVMILPFLLVQISWLAARHEIYEAPRSEPWPKGSYILFHLRILLLPAAICAMTSSLNWLELQPWTGAWFRIFPSLQLFAVLSVSGLFLVLSPFLMRLGLRSRSLPAGPLRTELEAVAARGKFHYLDIRVAQTEGRITNALFVGVLGRMRYVFITDGLIKKLSEDDMRGVFAHEMAHSKRGHILLNLALFLGFTLMLQLFSQGASRSDEDGVMAGMLMLIGLPLFLLFVFAPISRNWETEADVFSGEILGDPGPIKRALQVLGELNPRRSKNGGLTHPGIEARTAFLDAYFKEPAIASAFKARIKRLRFWVLIFFLVPALSWLVSIPAEYTLGRLQYDIAEASQNEDLSLAEAAEERLNKILDVGEVDPNYQLRFSLWTTLALIHEKSEDFDAAKVYVNLLQEHLEDTDELTAPYNTAVLTAQLAAGQGNIAAMLAPLTRAESKLKSLVEVLKDSDPRLQEEVRKERLDLEFMRGLEILARLTGRLPPARLGPDPTWREDPFHQAMGLAIDRARSGKLEAEEFDLLTANLSAGWKRSALTSLRP